MFYYVKKEYVDELKTAKTFGDFVAKLSDLASEGKAIMPSLPSKLSPFFYYDNFLRPIEESGEYIRIMFDLERDFKVKLD